MAAGPPDQQEQNGRPACPADREPPAPLAHAAPGTAELTGALPSTMRCWKFLFCVMIDATVCLSEPSIVGMARPQFRQSLKISSTLVTEEVGG